MQMRALIIGGTGLISTGIVTHLRARGADVTVYNRNQRENRLGPEVKTIIGDRDDADAFVRAFRDQRYDVVIDMICFRPQQAQESIAAFGGRCKQFIFCSTACTYGVKVPPSALVEETFPQEPISSYGRDKLACERAFIAADAAGQFRT